MPSYTSFQDPARYEIEQQKMRQNSVQQILNMMMMMKQNRQQQSQQEIENRMAEQSMALKQKEAESVDRYRRGQLDVGRRPPAQPTNIREAMALVQSGIAPDFNTAYRMVSGYKDPKPLEEQIIEKKALSAAGAEGAGTGKYKKVEQGKPDVYDKKIRDAKKALKENRITPSEYKQVVFGLTPEGEDYHGAKGASVRNANWLELDKIFNAFGGSDKAPQEAEKLYKKMRKGGPPITPDGVHLHMPFKYNHALKNRADRSETKEDKGIIERYDDLFRLFQERYAPARTFKNFMKMEEFVTDRKDKGMDLNQLRAWFAIFGG